MNVEKFNNYKIAVIIPAFRAAAHIEQVLSKIPDFVSTIVVIDDCSPDNTAVITQELACLDPRIKIIAHPVNKGVGGAVLSGYEAAYKLGADIIVKMDSDDQMDPAYIETLIAPITTNKADYVKGNRFLQERALKRMPAMRRIGNLGLSFLTKLASGYWNIFDPTNGYTALRASVVPLINPERIDQRYFFESSMLIELGLLRAVVKDVSIPARYGNEESSLSEWKSMLEFPPKLFKGLMRRFVYLYFIRDFTSVSVFFLAGMIFTLFGLIWGIWHWIVSLQTGIVASTGTVMLAALPLIVGVQLLLQSIVLDIQNTPSEVMDTDPYHP